MKTNNMKIGELSFKENYPDDYKRAIIPFSNYVFNEEDEQSLLDFIWDNVLNLSIDNKEFNFNSAISSQKYIIIANKHPDKERRLLVEIYIQNMDISANISNKDTNTESKTIKKQEIFHFLNQFDIDNSQKKNMSIIKEEIQETELLNKETSNKLFYLILTCICYDLVKLTGKNKLIHNIKAMGISEEFIDNIIKLLQDYDK